MTRQEDPAELWESWHNELVAKGIVTGTTPAFSHRIDTEKMLAGRKPTTYNIEQTPELRGELSLHAAIYRHYPKINVIIHALPPNIATVAQTTARKLRPLLDDFTQIVGVSVGIVDQPQDSAHGMPSAATIAALKRRNAVILRGNGALCCAHNFDEACAVALVLEKNCKALIEASFLGGGKVINIFEAVLMRYIYQKKYSKIAAPK